MAKEDECGKDVHIAKNCLLLIPGLKGSRRLAVERNAKKPAGVRMQRNGGQRIRTMMIRLIERPGFGLVHTVRGNGITGQPILSTGNTMLSICVSGVV